MEIESIATWNFRNLRPGPIDLPSGIDFFAGENGQGKTNLLEAIGVLGGLRSFRSPRLRSLVQHGQDFFRIEGRLRSASGEFVLELLWERGTPPRRTIAVNGAEVAVGTYLQVFPVVILSPFDRELVTGAPAGRRAFMDRLTFLLDARHLENLRVYRRLLQQRNAALVTPAHPRSEMELWEDRLARAAARVVAARRRTVDRLNGRFGRLYAELGGESMAALSVEYGSDAFLPPGDDESTLAEIYRKRYNDQRDRDRETGYTTAGPHRHDLMIRGVPGHVRDFLSTGQVKAVAAVLRLAFLEEVEEERGERLPLGIDDVDAEIDSTVTDRLIHTAARQRQLLVTSTAVALAERMAAPVHRFAVRAGSIELVAARGENE